MFLPQVRQVVQCRGHPEINACHSYLQREENAERIPKSPWILSADKACVWASAKSTIPKISTILLNRGEQGGLHMTLCLLVQPLSYALRALLIIFIRPRTD